VSIDSALVEPWLASMTHVSQSTIYAYRTALNRFMESGLAIESNVLAAFDQWLATGQYSTDATSLYGIALKRFLEWMTASGHLVDFNWGQALETLRRRRGTKAPRPRISKPGPSPMVDLRGGVTLPALRISDTITDELIEAMLDAWVDASPQTIISYRNCLKRAQALGIRITNDCLRELDYKMRHTPCDYGRRRAYAPATCEVHTVALTRYLTWLDMEDLAPPGFNLTKARTKLRFAHVRRKGGFVSMARNADPNLPLMVLYFQAKAHDPSLASQRTRRLMALRNYAIIEVLYSSGIRLAELISITRRQCQDGRLSEFLIVGKGNRLRMAYLSQPACMAIQAYCRERLDPNPNLFVNHMIGDNGRPISRVAIQTMVSNAAETLHLQPNTSPHSFRHWLATDLLNAGCPLDSIQVLLGHRSISTTQALYATLSTRKLKEHLALYRHDVPVVSP
jgi:integrase